jgi:glycine/D-amino acid oxidase-like deaminating enzyme
VSPEVDSVATPNALPGPVDVVVIGGGIVGASTALFLQQKGLRVALCEKGVIAGEQSSRNWGWCRAMGRDAREIPLIQESLRIWRRMDGLVGHDVGFRTCGIAYPARTQAELGAHAPWLEHSEKHQLGSRILTADALRALMPGLAGDFAGALYTPGDGRAEPARAAPAIARAVIAGGGTVLTNCAVRAVETTAGRVSGVVTERGSIAAGAVVLAGGAWSRLFCGNMDLDLPQLKVLGSVLRTAPIAGGPEISAAGSDYGFRKRADGGYSLAHGGLSTFDITPDAFRLFSAFLPALKSERKGLKLRLSRQFLAKLRQKRRWAADTVSPFEETRILDPEPDAKLLAAAMAAFRRLHPAFADAREVQRWGGMIDVTPDAVPVISDIAALPGFFVATGFSGHGFGLGPGAGRLMAEIVAGDAPVVDPAPFRFSRFADGSPITLDAGF